MPREVARLHVITDTRGRRDPLPEVAAVLAAGGRCIQVRGEGLSDRQLWDLSRRVIDLADPFAAHVVIDNRVDVAVISAANGVHVGSSDLPVEVIRRAFGRALIIGATARTPQQAVAAAAAGATYLGVGPVFGTDTKAGLPDPLGLAGVAAVVASTGLPVIAIGGISLASIVDVLGCGAHGVAVVSAISGAADPHAATVALLRELGGA